MTKEDHGTHIALLQVGFIHDSLGDTRVLEHVLTNISIHSENAIRCFGLRRSLRIRAGRRSAIALL